MIENVTIEKFCVSDCPLPSVVGGSVTFPVGKSGVAFGKSIIITCDKDFGLLNLGINVSLTCQADGNFSGLKSPAAECCKNTMFLAAIFIFYDEIYAT